MAKLIDGNAVSASVRARLRTEVQQLKAQGVTPGLAVVLVGENPASKVYVGRKAKTCEELGIYSRLHQLPHTTTQQELMALITQLNSDPAIHGILVQLPLPAHLDGSQIIAAIRPDKDVDAFHPQNVGGIVIGNYNFLPCTPAGIMELIASTGVAIKGKHCVVVGRSNIVGKPIAMLLLQAHGTVTICHSRTENLGEFCRSADILVASVGRAGLITADMVKPGAVVIDVGMNRNAAGKLCGDVDFDGVSKVAGYLTPVPGGVGPMTIAMLMQNTITAAKALTVPIH